MVTDSENLKPLGRESVITCTLEGELMIWEGCQPSSGNLAIFSTNSRAEADRLLALFGTRFPSKDGSGKITVSIRVQLAPQGTTMRAIEALQQEMLIEYQAMLDRASKLRTADLFSTLPHTDDGTYNKRSRKIKKPKKPPCAHCTEKSKLACKLCGKLCCGFHATFTPGVGGVCKEHKL